MLLKNSVISIFRTALDGRFPPNSDLASFNGARTPARLAVL
jgi:hypothetical protein